MIVTLKIPITTTADDNFDIFFICLFSREKSLDICSADDTHEMSRLFFSKNEKKKIYIYILSSATGFAWRFKG